MADAEGPAERLTRVLAAAHLRPTLPPIPVPSDSNDAWVIHDQHHGDVVLRVGWQGDTSRLLREGEVGRTLPAVAVGYPAVISFGRAGGPGALTWTLTRRLPGRSLRAAWPDLDDSSRARACAQVSKMITALHHWKPPVRLHSVLLPTPLGAHPTASSVVGRTILPFPDGVPVLMKSLRDASCRLDLVREAAKLFDRDADLAPQWDNPSTGVVHGDLHLDNVWWDGTHVSGVLDMEWVRAAPPYVDLARVKDNADADEADGIERHQLLLAVLVRDRPDVAEVDRLPERLRLLQVAHQLRQLWIDGAPSDEAATLPSDHPVSALTLLLGS